MSIQIRLALVGLLVLSVLTLSACPKRTTIGKIEDDPSKFNGKTVAIAGDVTSSLGFSLPGGRGGGVYKVDDGTGSIWVASRTGAPRKGRQVGVKGKVRTGLQVNGRTYGLVIVEDDRKIRSN